MDTINSKRLCRLKEQSKVIRFLHTGSRIFEIDFVKGMLVLTMIVYHSFVLSYNQTVLCLTKYVSGGFIFISGFLIGYYYLQNYRNDRVIQKRLLIRGLKIFLLFLAANIGLFYTKISTLHIDISEIIYKHYIIGTGQSRFEILLQISYTLFFVSLFISLIKQYSIIIGVLILAALTMMDFGIVNYYSNLFSISIGIFGLCCSLWIDKFRNTIGLQVCCFLLVILIGYINLLYSIDFKIVYVFYIIVVLMTFYNIGKSINLQSLKFNWILTMGRYSLFSYIYHLLLLFAVSRLYPFDSMNFFYKWFIVFFVTMILLVSLWVLDTLRKRIKLIERAYLLIFA